MAGSDNLGSSAQLPIQKLISDRCQVLGSVLTLFVVVASKTRRKDTGNSMLYLPVIFDSSRGLVAGLPAALEIPAYVVMKAVEESKTLISVAKDFQWRSKFKPHAIILTERKVPEQP